MSSDSIDTIIATVEDYYSDYKYLKQKNYDDTIKEMQEVIVQKYIEAMFKKKLSMNTYEERKKVVEKVRKKGLGFTTSLRTTNNFF